jgi:hypothetical protein
MIHISQEDQERLLRMAAICAANLAVEVILATEPFKSTLPPRVIELPHAETKPKRKRKTQTRRRNARKTPPTD